MSSTRSEIAIVQATAGSDLMEAAFRLRIEVFVHEQNVPLDEEIDADDPVATHFVALHDGDVVGTLRVVFEVEHARIGRVAVRADRRGMGIARQMMQAAMEHCRADGVDRFYLSAQVDKMGLYQKLGFEPFGPTYMDAGIPHRAMKTW